MAQAKSKDETAPPEAGAFQPGASDEAENDTGPSLIERVNLLEEKMSNLPEPPNFEQTVKSTIRTMLEGDSLDTIAAKVAERIEGLVEAVNAVGTPAFVLDEMHELRGLIDNTINAIEKSIGTRINRKVAPRVPPAPADETGVH